MMKYTAILIACLLVVFGISLAGETVKGKMTLKAGEEVYACNCGESCACQTISNQEKGKCGCGMALSKATVKKVGTDTADLQFANGVRTLKTVGKYVCGCGGECCSTISQKAGTCGCGKELVKVE